MSTVIIENADSKAVAAFKEMANALGLKARTEKRSKEESYNPAFVEKIEKSRQEIAEGKGVKINLEDLWK